MNIEEIINKIVWYVPFRKKRDLLRNELNQLVNNLIKEKNRAIAEKNKAIEEKNKIIESYKQIEEKNSTFKVINITDKKEYVKNIAIYFDAGIGDYLFLKPFFKYIRNYFKNDKLTFIGTYRIEDIFLFFDKEYIDEYICFNGKIKDNNYYKQLIDFFQNINYDILISYYYLRSINADKTINLINSKEKIGTYGGLLGLSKRQRVSDVNTYTKFIYPDENDKFELYRNMDFFKELLNNNNIEIDSLSIELNNDYFNSINFDFNQKYAIIFPSATDINRQWDPNNFSDVADHLYYKYNIISYIVGSEKDEELALKIIGDKKHIISICGKYHLHKLFFIFNKSKIVVTNDSGGYHIAMTVSNNIIVISSGGNYIRFTNYPEKYKKNKIVSTPLPEGALNKKDIEYFYNHDYLNTITSESICNLIDEKHSKYLKKDQTRPDQTRPDQTRPDQTIICKSILYFIIIQKLKNYNLYCIKKCSIGFFIVKFY